MTLFQTLAILCVAMGVLTIAKKADVNLMSIIQENKITVTDSGHAVNCGHVPINVTWTPKDLSPAGHVTIYLDFQLPYDFKGGFFNASLFFHGQTVPFVGYADNFDCDVVKTYIPCPLPKGFYLKTSKTITNLHDLITFPGYYDAIIQVWNTENQEMFCINLTVAVQTTRDIHYNAQLVL